MVYQPTLDEAVRFPFEVISYGNNSVNIANPFININLDLDTFSDPVKFIAKYPVGSIVVLFPDDVTWLN